ncbi:MAG TPA: cytochrome P450 [Acidimicrobiia bacterium]|nr:cytochrome P450 [Acidimicrobiia bacterium]
MAVIPRIEDLADPTFDPYLSDEAVFGSVPDPYPRIAELRAEAPVHAADYRAVMGIPSLDGEGAPPHYMVLSFAGVDQILNDPVTFSNRSFEPTLGAAFGHTVSVMDPPEHTRYRRILQQAFRPTIVQEWGVDLVGPIVDELVGAFRDSGRAELVEQFARPYPFTVIYRMLGLPRDDIDTFYKLTIAQIITYPDMTNALDASAKLGRYFTAMLAARRDDPGRDVVSVLATTEVDGEPLPDEVAISFLRQLINAGGDTTFRTTTMLLTGLLSHPVQLAAVRGDRSLAGAAIEEALRWDGPVLASSRLATTDTVVDGVPVPAGAFIDLLYGAANHDPAVFPDPETFDIFRPKHRHFGFAFGAHNCLGQQLARLELSRALNAVLDELPDLRLDPDHPCPQARGALMRTPKELRVVFG